MLFTSHGIRLVHSRATDFWQSLSRNLPDGLRSFSAASSHFLPWGILHASGAFQGSSFFHPFRIVQIGVLCGIHQPGQISVRIQLVFLRRLDQTENHGASRGSLGGIGEQEVLPVNNEGFHAPLCTVVGDFQSAVVQIIHQVRPLLSQISKCLTQGRLGM